MVHVVAVTVLHVIRRRLTGGCERVKRKMDLVAIFFYPRSKSGVNSMNRNLSGLSRVLQDMKSYFETDNRIMTVYIIGSYGTELETELSDIDFAILTRSKLSLLDDCEIIGQLSLLLKRNDVDVIFLPNRNIEINFRVILTGTKIYERDAMVSADFIEHTINMYQDYGHVLRQMTLEYLGLK